eukprot:686772-Alexandrium_andersonii.AAC.1
MPLQLHRSLRRLAAATSATPRAPASPPLTTASALGVGLRAPLDRPALRGAGSPASRGGCRRCSASEASR